MEVEIGLGRTAHVPDAAAPKVALVEARVIPMRGAGGVDEPDASAKARRDKAVQVLLDGCLRGGAGEGVAVAGAAGPAGGAVTRLGGVPAFERLIENEGFPGSGVDQDEVAGLDVLGEVVDRSRVVFEGAIAVVAELGVGGDRGEKQGCGQGQGF